MTLIMLSGMSGDSPGCEPTSISTFSVADPLHIAEKVGKLLETIIREVEAPSSIDDDWTETTAALDVFMLGIPDFLREEDDWDRLDAVGEHLELYAKLFSTSPWRWWRRRQLIRRIKSSRLPKPTPQ